jgi:hypothetical protein
MLAAVAVLAGCGGGGASTSTPATSPRTPSTAPAPTTAPAPARTASDQRSFPLLADVWLSQSDLNPRRLARYDLVVLDMEWAHRDPAGLREIRRLNPGIRILAYVPAQEVFDPERIAGVADGFRYRRQLDRDLAPSWYLHDGSGDPVVFFPGTRMVNPTTGWSDHLARFMATTVMGTGLFDGVYYDNAWASPTWLNGGDIDLDADGRADLEEHGARWIADTWNRAMDHLFAETRRLRPGLILMGNGSAAGYEHWSRFTPILHRGLNGALDEHWPTLDRGWDAAVDRIHGWLRRAEDPAFFVVQADTDRRDDPRADPRGFRLALGTSLLTGAYLAYDRGDHEQDDWWFPEYSGDGRGRGWLGLPSGPARRLASGVWIRRFAGGLVLVNPAGADRRAALPAGSWTRVGADGGGSVSGSASVPAGDAVLLAGP